MSDWITVVFTTLVGPGAAALIAYLVTMRKERATAKKTIREADGVSADTAMKYKQMLNDEIDRRRQAETRCDEMDDAFKQAVEENGQLREENMLLRAQLRSLGHLPATNYFKHEGKEK